MIFAWLIFIIPFRESLCNASNEESSALSDWTGRDKPFPVSRIGRVLISRFLFSGSEVMILKTQNGAFVMNDFVILADGNPIATSDIASEMSDLFTSGTHDGFHGPFAEAHAAGARFFIMVDDSDSEMRVVRLDENMRPDMTTLHAAADAEIAEYDGLRLSSPDQDYDSWLDDTGLDPSAYGGFGVPGSIEKYLAAQRFALCEQAGIGTSSPLPSL